MEIKKTYSRKTKKNHFRSYFADDGLILWYVSVNKREITSVRKRIYTDAIEEICTENAVQIAELPQVVFDFIIKDLDGEK